MFPSTCPAPITLSRLSHHCFKEKTKPLSKEALSFLLKTLHYCVFLFLSIPYCLSRRCSILPIKWTPPPECMISFLFYLYNHAISTVFLLLFFSFISNLKNNYILFPSLSYPQSLTCTTTSLPHKFMTSFLLYIHT